MEISKAAINVLDQLQEVLEKLMDDQFIAKCEALGGSSIGQHVRHLLEFFVCLESGLATGTVNYDKRKRDLMLENDRFAALGLIAKCKKRMKGLSEDRNSLNLPP